MDFETIKLNKQLMNNVRTIISRTGLFKNETDFIEQAIIKQISKMRDS